MSVALKILSRVLHEGTSPVEAEQALVKLRQMYAQAPNIETVFLKDLAPDQTKFWLDAYLREGRKIIELEERLHRMKDEMQARVRDAVKRRRIEERELTAVLTEEWQTTEEVAHRLDRFPMVVRKLKLHQLPARVERDCDRWRLKPRDDHAEADDAAFGELGEPFAKILVRAQREMMAVVNDRIAALQDERDELRQKLAAIRQTVDA